MHVIQPSKMTLTEEEMHKQGDVLLQHTVCHLGLTVVGHQGNMTGIFSVWYAKSADCHPVLWLNLAILAVALFLCLSFSMSNKRLLVVELRYVK